MTTVVDLLLGRLSAMRGRIRPAFVTYRNYKSEEYQSMLRAGGIEDLDAESIASFIKDAAIAARVPEVVGMAELVLREVPTARAANPERDDDPPRTPRAIANLGTMHAEFWRPHAEREAAEELRWMKADWITTSHIAERLIPRWFSATQVFGLLKEMGYVSGLPRNYQLTAKSAEIGEVRGDPKKPGRIYWRKQMFDIVQGEIDRRRALGGWVSLPDPRDIEA